MFEFMITRQKRNSACVVVKPDMSISFLVPCAAVAEGATDWSLTSHGQSPPSSPALLLPAALCQPSPSQHRINWPKCRCHFAEFFLSECVRNIYAMQPVSLDENTEYWVRQNEDCVILELELEKWFQGEMFQPLINNFKMTQKYVMLFSKWLTWLWLILFFF